MSVSGSTAVCDGVVRRSCGALLVTLAVALASGCQSDSLKPAPLADKSELFWDLDLNHHAVTLATTALYDTLTLAAVPRNYQAEALPGLPAPTYRSADVERVSVTSGGMLVAVSARPSPTWVYATLTAGHVKHTDSVLVKVVDNPAPPVLASFSVHPIPPDSAKAAAIGRAFFLRA